MHTHPVSPKMKALIVHHLQEATKRIAAMDAPDDALILSAIDAQDAALVALNGGRLPGFLVRRGLAKIQRPTHAFQGNGAV